MSIETGVLVDLERRPLHWHLPPGRNAGYLPDSPDLWQVIWHNRENILGFAHSHPGMGMPTPSHEDLSTFKAIEQALGKRLHWWIISQDCCITLVWSGNCYSEIPTIVMENASWLGHLHDLSYNS